MRRLITVLWMVGASLTAFGAQAAAPTQEEIAGLFTQWNAALATGDSAKVTALYADNGVLLPTVSNQVRDNHAEIKNYFDRFLKMKPQGKIDEQHIAILDDNTAVNSGIYTFTLHKDGRVKNVQARYTYVYEKIGDAWKIMVHHSSVMPEPKGRKNR
jgi:uncharacterized protein (TIGR02246 family)